MSEAEGVEVLEGEVVEDEPAAGTLAWLALQPHTEVAGLGAIPVCHRLDLVEGSLYLGDDDGRCRYVRPGERRCGAPRLLAYGLCLVHSGGGSDLQEIGRKGAATQARLRLSRQMLGVTYTRGADPRQMTRIAATARAQEIADAVLAPLDDEQLSALAKHGAALRILDATFPQQQVTLTVDVPADEAGVNALGWAEMQQLAAQLLGDTSETEALEPA